MWKKPIRQKGARESDFAYAAKLIWIKTKYDDSYDELTLAEIIEKIDYYANLVGISIEYYKKDGVTLEKADYDLITAKWIPKYKWHECYTAYENEMNHESKVKALLIFDKKLLKDTITDFKTIDKIDERTSQLFEQQKLEDIDNTYRIAKLEETKNSVWHRIVERLDLTSESDDTDETKYLPVEDNPKHETQENREFWNSILWDLVEKRQ